MATTLKRTLDDLYMDSPSAMDRIKKRRRVERQVEVAKRGAFISADTQDKVAARCFKDLCTTPTTFRETRVFSEMKPEQWPIQVNNAIVPTTCKKTYYKRPEDDEFILDDSNAKGNRICTRIPIEEEVQDYVREGFEDLIDSDAFWKNSPTPSTFRGTYKVDKNSQGIQTVTLEYDCFVSIPFVSKEEERWDTLVDCIPKDVSFMDAVEKNASYGDEDAKYAMRDWMSQDVFYNLPDAEKIYYYDL